MPLPREHLLDELATAYVQIIAAAGGAKISVSRNDYGVDGTLNRIEEAPTADGTQFIPSGFPVDFQLKGTTVALEDEQVRYDLKARNYDLIVTRPPHATPYYLFLVCVDPGPETWFASGPRELILRASAYWWTDAGPKTSNSSTVRLSISADSRLTSDAIEGMLQASKERFER